MCSTLYAILAIVTLTNPQISVVSAQENVEIQINTNTSTSLADQSLDSTICSTKISDCTIRANITMQTKILLPVVIDCSSNRTDTGRKDLSYTTERYKNIRNVSMDGRCSNVPRFGLEHFPDVNRTLDGGIFTNFRVAIVQKDLFDSMSSVKEITLRNNTFESVAGDAFESVPLLTMLTFEKNRLRSIAMGVFDRLTNLVSLILDEPKLLLKDEHFFENMNCEKLSVAVKQVPQDTFQRLPQNLRCLNVNNMSFDEMAVKNPGNMTYLYINDNKIGSLSVMDVSKLKFINARNNHIEKCDFSNCTSLEVLDLSYNMLQDLPRGVFQDMKQLKYVYLQNNQLKTLSTDAFQGALASLIKIDLSNNTLRSISITQDTNPNPDLKIIINANPWDCLWILDVFNERPDFIRVFQYEKYVSRINVNGLQCEKYLLASTIPNENLDADLHSSSAEESEDPDEELERTLRKHILHGLLVFTGLVAIALLVLYIWSKCRNMARLPFYESLKQSQWTQDRFDVIRRVPQDESPEYEIPLQYFDSNSNLEHVELLDTIGNLEPIIGIPNMKVSSTEDIYEEISENS